MENDKTKLRFFSLVLLAVIAGGAVWLFGASSPAKVTVSPQDSKDAFAQCIAEKRITMYGADWCPHCQNEKKAFGDSFRFIPYVECPKEPKLCLDAGINGYPTWIFPDGKRLEGEQGLQKLSKESGCALPQ